MIEGQDIPTKEMDESESRRQFRIAIFGTGSDKTEADKNAKEYAAIFSSIIIEDGFSIVTGGYEMGVMQSASEAALRQARKLNIVQPEQLIKSIPLEERFLKTPIVSSSSVYRASSLLDRLTHLIDDSCGFVVLGGKFGTLVEFITTIHSEKVRQLPERKPPPRSIIVIDPKCELLDTFNYIVDQDPVLQKSDTLYHLYFFAGHKGWDQKARKILNLYYLQSRGESLSNADVSFLKNLSFKYSYDNFIGNLKNAGFHL